MAEKKRIKKRPKVVIRKVNKGEISPRKLKNIASKAAYAQQKVRLAEIRFQQKLMKEFRHSYEDYIG